MANETKASGTSSAGWEAKQAYALAVVCLLIGLVVGYLFRGSRSPVVSPPNPAEATAGAPSRMNPPRASGGQAGGHPVTLEQMKQMAEKKAEPLLAKLKDDPKNADLLGQVGAIYMATHQFKEAGDYFARALEADPKNLHTRTQLASCLYYNGDVDGALQELNRAIAQDPKDANSLFNLGMIRWQGKSDRKGALEAWGKLLKTNPQLEPAKRAQVEKLMAEVRGQNPAN